MYRTIDASFWTDPKIAELDTDCRLVFLYLITNPHSHVGGIYSLQFSYLCIDTGLSDRVSRRAIDTLSKTGLIRYDGSKAVVWVVNMFNYQGRGEKNERAVANLLETLHGSELVDQFLVRYPSVRKYLERPLRPRRAGIKNALRFKILERDGFKCVYCGVSSSIASLEVDHRTPVSRGGKDEESNLATSCWDCNNGKSDTLSSATDTLSKDTPSEGGTPNRIRTGADPDQEKDQEQEGNSPGKPGSRDHAADYFAEEHKKHTGTGYPAKRGDFVKLAELRKANKIGGKETPDGWEQAVANYFTSPLPAYTLADLSNRFPIYRNSATGPNGKPINHRGNHAAATASRSQRQTEAVHRYLAEDSGGNDASKSGGRVDG